MATISGRDFTVIMPDVHLEDYFPNQCETEHGGHDLGEPRPCSLGFAWWLERECSRCKVSFMIAETEE